MTAVTAQDNSASITTDVDATTMHGVVQSEYGGPEVLEFADVERPTPDSDEVF